MATTKKSRNAVPSAVATRSLTAPAKAAPSVGVISNPALQLSSGSVVESSITGRHYRVGRLLGAGGFGAVYEVIHARGGESLTGKCVLKVTLELKAWHREAYYGELLKETPGIVRIHESFAWVRAQNHRKPLYCLISELVEGGDLDHHLSKHPEPWSEAKARREIVRLLSSVRLLHASGLVHRDITPRNVFVTPRRELKLADFGIAALRLGKQRIKADAFAPWFAPTAIQSGKSGSWLPADDVYQLGKLFALLLHGGQKSKLAPRDVKALHCSPWAKAVIQRCIGERRKRYANAAEMCSALEKREKGDEDRRVIVRSLDGKLVVFTGKLSMPRKKAEELLVKRCGGIAQARVTQETDIVVVGEQSPNWKAEGSGQKLLDLERERERGHEIAVITERRFKKLVRF